MKTLPIFAIVILGLATACTIREERTVQQPVPAATVVASPPPATVVYTDPAPATTTVYTTR